MKEQCCRHGDFAHMCEVLLKDEASGAAWDAWYPVDDNWPADDQLASYAVSSMTMIMYPQHPHLADRHVLYNA